MKVRKGTKISGRGRRERVPVKPVKIGDPYTAPDGRTGVVVAVEGERFKVRYPGALVPPADKEKL